MQRYWFGDVEDGGCCPADGNPASVAERAATLGVSMKTFVPLDWRIARECGFVRDREEYIAKLREVTMHLAREKIAERFRGGDAELLSMVRMLDDLDSVINLLNERAAEWYLVAHPTFSRKYRTMPARKMIAIVGRQARGGMKQVAEEIDRLYAARTALMQEVSARAFEVLPNTSALVGGLVAARLLSRAGSLEALSRMPASTIQVLGSERALFSHLRSGTPPPKHGIIFQHRRVHNAPKAVRGRVARVLAAKVSIAARLDYHRGAADPAFIREASARIDAAGEAA